MPFIDDYNLLFVHIPKTGGYSIEKKFGIEKTENNCFSYTEEKYNNIIFAPQHFTPDLIEKYYPKRYKHSLKFTIVRNPYSKLISEFFYRKWTWSPGNFHDFITKIPYGICDHNLPQKRYFGNNILYNHVLKFENLKEDFANMSRDYGFSPDLPHENKSSVKTNDYISEINRETLDLINDYYKEDFEFLKYEKI